MLFVVAIALSLGACQRDISGKYMAKDPNGIFWVELVRTPDNHLTGQIETTSMSSSDGKIARKTVPVTGAVNGTNVTITASTWGVSTLSLAGSLDHSKLTLTGFGTGPVMLMRSDLGEYERESNNLNSRAEQIISANLSASARAKAERERMESEEAQIEATRRANDARAEIARQGQNFATQVDRLITGMKQYDTQADGLLVRFSTAETKYRTITGKINAYVERERQLAGNSNASVARGQLDVNANQGSVATEQLHNSALSLQSLVESNVQSLAAQVAGCEQTCKGFGPPNDWPEALIELQKRTCQNLAVASGEFRQKFEVVARGLAHLEETYRQEMRTQAQLIRTADSLE
jgi:hypothetical protein